MAKGRGARLAVLAKQAVLMEDEPMNDSRKPPTGPAHRPVLRSTPRPSQDPGRTPPTGPASDRDPARGQDGVSAGRREDDDENEVAALAKAWPRILIAAGEGEALATWWCAARAEATASGRPPFPHVPVDASLLGMLFEVRRARRLVRGFEAIEQSLTAQEAGMRRAPATRPQEVRRISRLLVLTQDAAPRLYRNAEKLLRQYSDRLEVLVLECDESVLGSALYGEGKRVRAVLLDHKEAVVDLLAAVALGPEAYGDAPDEQSPGREPIG